MPNHCTVITFTLVKFLLSLAAFTEVLIVVYTHEKFIQVSKLCYHSKKLKCKQGITLVKMVPGSWRDLGKIPPRFPPGSRRDFGRRDSRFPPGFLPGFLAGGGIPGGQNLGRIPAAKISAGSRRESCRDSWREVGSRRPKSRQDSGGSLAGILGGRRDSQRPKTRQDPGGSLAGILGG